MGRQLTDAELTALRDDINSAVAGSGGVQLINLGGTMVAIKDTGNSPDNNEEVAQQWYNLIAAPDFWIWDTQAEIAKLLDNVIHKNYTPTDSVPANDSNNQYLNRTLVCQTKQMLLDRFILSSRTGKIDASKTKIWQGIKDALENLPSGVSGALLDGGWVNVRDNCLQRKAKNVEKLLKTGGIGTHGDAATPTYDGSITGVDVSAARRVPVGY